MRINPVNSAQYYMQPQKSKDNVRIKIPVSTTSYKSNDIAFTGWVIDLLKKLDKYAPPPTLEELQKLAKDAQHHHDPLSDAIYRGDFKGIIPKEKIIEILKSEHSKAKYTGTKQGYQELIDHVKKTH